MQKKVEKMFCVVHKDDMCAIYAKQKMNLACSDISFFFENTTLLLFLISDTFDFVCNMKP